MFQTTTVPNNNLLYHNLLAEGALRWLGIDLDLTFLGLITYIGVIAAVVVLIVAVALVGWRLNEGRLNKRTQTVATRGPGSWTSPTLRRLPLN